MEEDVQVDIQGYDADGDIVKAARSNARSAGVDHMIHFQRRPVSAMSHPKKYGFIISNPPYGERIEEKENLPALYREIGERFAALDPGPCTSLLPMKMRRSTLGGRRTKTGRYTTAC